MKTDEILMVGGFGLLAWYALSRQQQVAQDEDGGFYFGGGSYDPSSLINGINNLISNILGGINTGAGSTGGTEGEAEEGEGEEGGGLIDEVIETVRHVVEVVVTGAEDATTEVIDEVTETVSETTGGIPGFSLPDIGESAQAAAGVATRQVIGSILTGAGPATHIPGAGTIIKGGSALLKGGTRWLTGKTGQYATTQVVKVGGRLIPQYARTGGKLLATTTKIGTRAIPILGWGLLLVDLGADVARLFGADVTEWLGFSPIIGAFTGENPIEAGFGTSTAYAASDVMTAPQPSARIPAVDSWGVIDWRNIAYGQPGWGIARSWADQPVPGLPHGLEITQGAVVAEQIRMAQKAARTVTVGGKTYKAPYIPGGKDPVDEMEELVESGVWVP